MSAQHTPAPWLVDSTLAQVIVPNADAPICQMLWPTDLRSVDETFANACLIAEAPAMYDALQWYAEQFCEHSKYSEVCGRLGDDACSGCKARAILARIDGGKS